ncbi:hypothetical protein PCL_05303 [Purpureocillium lilacinum]|uniref:Fungal calcium binding protein domain-containing protein n=1 Tax=Purpureocillium lilacinum TaxID=33203 RepID=A0A2U3DV08_PURLI|nr:hypothetical protein PCL_05303 [Purpureocillium lilacinum]
MAVGITKHGLQRHGGISQQLNERHQQYASEPPRTTILSALRPYIRLSSNMKASTALLALLAGFVTANPTTNDNLQRRQCPAGVDTAVNAGVSAVKMAFTLGGPANLQAALDEGVKCFKAKLGC